jgi:hypothetical protein
MRRRRRGQPSSSSCSSRGRSHLWTDYERASKLGDHGRLKELELLCDAFAIVTLQGLGMDPSRLITGIEKILIYNRQLFGPAVNESGYPTLSERREFARAVRPWAARGRPAGAPRQE